MSGTSEDPKLAALFMLAGALRAHGFVVEDSMVTATVITGAGRFVLSCRPRAEDGGALWFWVRFSGGDNRPLAPADQIMNALVAVKGLAG